MSALDFASLLQAEKRKARAARSPSTPAVAPAPAQTQQSPDANTAALESDRPRPALKVLPGAPPTIAYAAEWISEEEEASIIAAAKSGEDWVDVRGRRLRRLGGPAGEVGFVPEPLPRWARDACAAAATSDPANTRPVPNHVLVNAYDFSKASYVLPHTDGPAYDDRTFTLSCGADAVVVFRERLKTSEVGVRVAAARCEVLLRRRSLLAFSRVAYAECTHEIGSAPDVVGAICANLDAANCRVGDVVGRAGERVSFTLRYACGGE